MPLLARRTGLLSGGQQQIAALALGLLCSSRLLPLDEPTLGLAPVGIDQVIDVLVQPKSECMSMLVVEQNAMFALRLADRGYVVVGGAVSLDGTAAVLRGSDELRAAYLGA